LTAKKWGDYEMRSTEKRALPVLLRVFDNAQNDRGGYSKILSFIGRQSFWIMALHFAGFKIGSAILNLFINTDVSSLTPTASNVFIVAFYLFAGIFIPCVVGVAIEKTKKLVIR
jgi:hypothetical protein